MDLQRGLIARLCAGIGVCVAIGVGRYTHLDAQTTRQPMTTVPGADVRLTVQDVERVTRMKGLQIVGPAEVPGAGPGLNFAGPDRKMVLMATFGTADLYRRARAQTHIALGGKSVPMHLFHANVPNIGDEAFDSPPGALQYVLYLRKGEQAASLTTFVGRDGKTTVLTIEQLKQLGALVASRL